METTNLFIHKNQFQDIFETLKDSTTFGTVEFLDKDKVNFLSALVGIANECCISEIENISIFGKKPGKEIEKDNNIEETNFFHGNLVPDIQEKKEPASGNIVKIHIPESNPDNVILTDKFTVGDDLPKANIDNQGSKAAAELSLPSAEKEKNDNQGSKAAAELSLPSAEKEKNNNSMQRKIKPGWLKENIAGDIEQGKGTKIKRAGDSTANQATDKIVENTKIDISPEKTNRTLKKEDLFVKQLKTVNDEKAVMQEEQSADKGRGEGKKNFNYNQEIENKNVTDLNKNKASVLNKRLNNPFLQQDSISDGTNNILQTKYPAIKSKNNGNRINSLGKYCLEPDGEFKNIKNTEEINTDPEKGAVVSKQKTGIFKELFNDSKVLDTGKLDVEDKKQEVALLQSRNIGKTSGQVLSDHTD